MARVRQPRETDPPEGPPGLGGTPNGPMPIGYPVPDDELHNELAGEDSSGTNRESRFADIREHQPNARESALGIIDIMKQIPAKLAEESERLTTLWSEFTDQNAIVEQINGQIRALEQNLAQSIAVWQETRNAVLTLQQRLDALARQQVHTNTRMAALQLAAQNTKGAEAPEKIVERAERFYMFLLGDLVTRAQEKQYETKMLNPDDPTQH